MRTTSALPLLALAIPASCDCDCGYRIEPTALIYIANFTEVLETDFLHVSDFSSDWTVQSYNVTPSASGGTYGKIAQVGNVIPKLLEPGEWGWDTVHDPDPGLALWTNTSLVDIPGTDGEQMIPMSELVSKRDNILYGTFRIAMKTTQEGGGCESFSFRHSDGMETVMEFVSEDLWQMTLGVHSPASAETGGVVNQTSLDSDLHTPDRLRFDPGKSYNEYRFDWFPDRVEFLVNGQRIHRTYGDDPVPNKPGRIHIGHWSNGVGVPPVNDAAMWVMYVKAYFNSSSPETTKKSLERCKQDSEPCKIPYLDRSPTLLQTIDVGAGKMDGKSVFLTPQGDPGPKEDPEEVAKIIAAANMATGKSIAWGCLFVGVLFYITSS